MARFHMALSHPSWARTCAWLPRLGISAGKEASSKSTSSLLPDGASRSFLPTAMCSTPITASPECDQLASSGEEADDSADAASADAAASAEGDALLEMHQRSRARHRKASPFSLA